MANYQVVCITKPNPDSTHEHITDIGYYESSLKPNVNISVDEVIRRIEGKIDQFYVSTPAGTAYVKVERPNNRRAYIRTEPDRTDKDNLLRLDQCKK